MYQYMASTFYNTYCDRKDSVGLSVGLILNSLTSQSFAAISLLLQCICLSTAIYRQNL